MQASVHCSLGNMTSTFTGLQASDTHHLCAHTRHIPQLLHSRAQKTVGNCALFALLYLHHPKRTIRFDAKHRHCLSASKKKKFFFFFTAISSHSIGVWKMML